jgi:hypothetical protein
MFIQKFIQSVKKIVLHTKKMYKAQNIYNNAFHNFLYIIYLVNMNKKVTSCLQ